MLPFEVTTGALAGVVQLMLWRVCTWLRTGRPWFSEKWESTWENLIGACRKVPCTGCLLVAQHLIRLFVL